MNIVWLRAEPLLPLDTGNKIRSYNLLRGISREEAVTYVGLRFDQTLSTDISSLFRSVAITVPAKQHRKYSLGFYLEVLGNLGSAYPYYMRRYGRPEVKAEIRKLVNSGACQVIICDGLESAINLDFALPVPKVLYHHAVETTLWQQRYEASNGIFLKSYYNYETKRMADYERAALNRFDHVIATNERERELLMSEFNIQSPVTVVPVGVDCTYFKPEEYSIPDRKRLLFSGSLDSLSNIDQLLWFVSEVYPVVKREHPGVSLDIIGPNPAPEVADLQTQDRSIRVLGWVDDVRPYLEQCDIFIVPLRVAGGTRIKLYEAMAMRRPVVSTTFGAEGLDVLDGQHLLIADTAREFAEAVNGLFSNSVAKKALAERAWRYVNGSHDWSVMAHQMLDLVRSMTPRTAIRQK